MNKLDLVFQAKGKPNINDVKKIKNKLNEIRKDPSSKCLNSDLARKKVDNAYIRIMGCISMAIVVPDEAKEKGEQTKEEEKSKRKFRRRLVPLLSTASLKLK